MRTPQARLRPGASGSRSRLRQPPDRDDTPPDLSGFAARCKTIASLPAPVAGPPPLGTRRGNRRATPAPTAPRKKSLIPRTPEARGALVSCRIADCPARLIVWRRDRGPPGRGDPRRDLLVRVRSSRRVLPGPEGCGNGCLFPARRRSPSRLVLLRATEFGSNSGSSMLGMFSTQPRPSLIRGQFTRALLQRADRRL
jgi:hypothetical protein